MCDSWENCVILNISICIKERNQDILLSIRGQNQSMRQISISNIGENSSYPYWNENKSSRFPKDSG